MQRMDTVSRSSGTLCLALALCAALPSYALAQEKFGGSGTAPLIGFQFRLGYHPGVRRYVEPAAPPPPPAAPPSPPSPEPSRPEPAPVEPAVVEPGPTFVPTEAPVGVAPEVPVDNSFERGAAGVPRGTGSPDGVPGGFGDVLRPPPLAPVPPPRDPVPVGGRIDPPRKVRDVAPVYPVVAVQSRTDGRVIVEATIGVDGRVTNTRVLQGHPLLVDAAVTAVSQWEFTPTLLNGEPIPVLMSVTVWFRLR